MGWRGYGMERIWMGMEKVIEGEGNLSEIH